MARCHAIFCLVAVVALAHNSNLASAQAANGTLQFTEKWLSSRIGYNMMHISDNMKKAMSGGLKQTPTQQPQKVIHNCTHLYLEVIIMPRLPITVSAMPAWPSMLLVLHVFTVQQHCRWMLRQNNECICTLIWKC